MKLRHLPVLFVALSLLTACSPSQKQPEPPPATPAASEPAKQPTLAEQNDLAFTLIKQAKWEEAIAAATKASQLDSANASAWFNLGRAYLGAGKAPEAVAALRQASELTNGGNADTEYYLGKAYEAAGQSGSAWSVYKAAKAKWPDDKEIEAAYSRLALPHLVALQQAAVAYATKNGPDQLRTLATTLEAYLRSPDSKNMGGEGNAMGVMAVYGEPPNPRTVRLHTPGYIWIQWWQGDQPLVYRLVTPSPRGVTWSVSFKDGETWYMVMEQNPVAPPVSRTAVLYRLDAAAGQWLQVKDAFQPFPAKVGGTVVQSGPDSITITDGSLRFEERGRTVKICEAKPQGACATATWDGKHYVSK